MPSKKTRTRATTTRKDAAKGCGGDARTLAEARAEVVPVAEGCDTENSVGVDVNCNNSYNLATIGFVKALLCRHDSCGKAHDGRFDELRKLIDTASKSITIRSEEYGEILYQIFADGRWFIDGKEWDRLVRESVFLAKVDELAKNIGMSEEATERVREELSELIARNEALIAENKNAVIRNASRIEEVEEGIAGTVDEKVKAESESIRGDMTAYTDAKAAAALTDAKLHADNAVLVARSASLREHAELEKVIDGKVGLESVGKPSGIASLDAAGTVPVSQLPESVRGCLKRIGVLSPIEGRPSTPPPDNAEKGHFYEVAADLVVDGVKYLAGDWILCTETSPAVVWKRVSASSDVVSVDGKRGEVKLAAAENDPSKTLYWTAKTVSDKLSGKMDVQSDLVEGAVVVGGADGKLRSSPVSGADLERTKTLAEGAVQKTSIGAADGVAGLDSQGKIKEGQLPDSMKNGLRFRGTWDGRTKTFVADGSTVPDTPSDGYEAGYYWITAFSDPGEGVEPVKSVVFPPKGGETYTKGDWLVVSESASEAGGFKWSKVEVSNDVSDVEGQTGSVKIFAKGPEEKQTSDSRTWTAKEIAEGFAGTVKSATVGIDGQTAVVADGDLKIPVAGKNDYGVSRVDGYFGITAYDSGDDKGKLVAVGATEDDLKNRGGEYPIRLITSYNLDKAVKCALVGNGEEFSEPDKDSARTLIGATLVEIVDYDDE